MATDVAGQLGVALTDHLAATGLLDPVELTLTESGCAGFTTFGVDVTSLRAARRPLTRACLDWSERRPHLAGAVGGALARELLSRGWLRRVPETRAVTLTAAGARGLHIAFEFTTTSCELAAAP